MREEEVVVTNTYINYISNDERKFQNKDECLKYEKWLETNTRNIPTKEQFDSLKVGDKVYYKGSLYFVEYPPNHFEKDTVTIGDRRWDIVEVHYTELDLIKE